MRKRPPIYSRWRAGWNTDYSLNSGGKKLPLPLTGIEILAIKP
jgi:hypothetical protein